MRTNRWRAYIKPFDDAGNYTDWIDVTEDVDFSSISNLTQDLDNTDYNIGIYRNSVINLVLNNQNGRYSDVTYPNSIFRFTRSDSLFKLTWEIEEDGPWCADAISGDSWLSEEMTLFLGLLNDESLALDLVSQEVDFKVLGVESIISRAIVPSSVIVGDTFSQAIYKCLNQDIITGVLTVDSGNISVGTNVVLDSVTDLQNLTVKDALDTLLLLSNSVLYITDGSIIISPRTASVTVKKVFYGQSSLLGVEDIQNLSSIRNGLNRTFNYFSWQDSAALAQDSTSILRYGTRTKEIDSALITDLTKQNTILSALLAEFKNPKQEMELFTALNYTIEALVLLDRVEIDYPNVFVSDEFPLPICGIAVLGTAVLPKGIFSFTISTDTDFKIIGRAIDTKTGIVKFKLREV